MIFNQNIFYIRFLLLTPAKMCLYLKQRNNNKSFYQLKILQSFLNYTYTSLLLKTFKILILINFFRNILDLLQIQSCWLWCFKMYAHTHTHTHTHAHTHTHIYIYVYIYTRTCYIPYIWTLMGMSHSS